MDVKTISEALWRKEKNARLSRFELMISPFPLRIKACKLFSSTVASLIRNNNESNYISAVQKLVQNSNNLDTNVSKTEEIIVDCRLKQYVTPPLVIKNSGVEIFSDSKFLGIKISDDLKWEVIVC